MAVWAAVIISPLRSRNGPQTRMVVEFLVELPNPLLALQFVCTLSIISLIFSHDELDCNQMTIGETPCGPPSRRPVTSDDE